MKSITDPFESDLRKRLEHYAEEPRTDLWENIAPHIGKVGTTPPFTRWMLLLSGLMLVTTLYVGDVSTSSLEQPLANSQPELFEPKPNANAKILETKLNEESTINTHRASGSALEEENAIVANGKASSPDSPKPIQTQQLKTIADVEQYSSSNLQSNEFADTRQENGNVAFNGKPQPTISHDQKTQAANVDSVGRVDDKPKLKAKPKPETQKAVVIPVRKKKGLGRSSIYIIAMPTFGYQRIESNHNDNIIIEKVKQVSMFSSKRLGVRAEIGLEYSLSARVKLFAGLVYFQRKQTIDFTTKEVDSLAITGGNGQITIEPVFKHVDKSIEYDLKNIGLQTGVNYELSRKAFLHVLGIGIEFHKPINKSSFHEIEEGFGQRPNYYVFLNMYYRLQYPSEGRLRAVFQPSLNYSMYINQHFNAPFYVKPYGLGLHLGLTYNF